MWQLEASHCPQPRRSPPATPHRRHCRLRRTRLPRAPASPISSTPPASPVAPSTSISKARRRCFSPSPTISTTASSWRSGRAARLPPPRAAADGRSLLQASFRRGFEFFHRHRMAATVMLKEAPAIDPRFDRGIAELRQSAYTHFAARFRRLSAARAGAPVAIARHRRASPGRDVRGARESLRVERRSAGHREPGGSDGRLRVERRASEPARWTAGSDCAFRIAVSLRGGSRPLFPGVLDRSSCAEPSLLALAVAVSELSAWLVLAGLVVCALTVGSWRPRQVGGSRARAGGRGDGRGVGAVRSAAVRRAAIRCDHAGGSRRQLPRQHLARSPRRDAAGACRRPRSVPRRRAPARRASLAGLSSRRRRGSA